MKPEKWSTRRYVMFGALAGAAIMMLLGWLGSSAPELDWWGYAGYIGIGVVGGALTGAALPVLKNRKDR